MLCIDNGCLLHFSFFFFFAPTVFTRAMASTSGKEQFLKQFDEIVAGVKRNKAKVKHIFSTVIFTIYSVKLAFQKL